MPTRFHHASHAADSAIDVTANEIMQIYIENFPRLRRPRQSYRLNIFAAHEYDQAVAHEVDEARFLRAFAIVDYYFS